VRNDLENLSETIGIDFPKDAEVVSGKVAVCVYLDENKQWSKVGYSMEVVNNKYRCKCNYATEFAIVEESALVPNTTECTTWCTTGCTTNWTINPTSQSNANSSLKTKSSSIYAIVGAVLVAIALLVQ
jgi:hypothetical protein